MSDKKFHLNSPMQDIVVTETQISLFTHSHSHSRVSKPVINWD